MRLHAEERLPSCEAVSIERGAMIHIDEVQFPYSFTFVGDTDNMRTDHVVSEALEALKALEPRPGAMVATGEALVVLNASGFIEVYLKAAECEVEVEW